MLQLLNLKAKMLIFIVLLCALLLISRQAVADNTTDLYLVEILVVDESASVRSAAFKQGLDEIFVRISGDSIIMDKLKRPAASSYVKQYSYEPVEIPTINLQDELLTHRLKVQYNRSLVEKYLQQNGFPVWGEHRPELVVWLAVRDGANEYVLKKNDLSLLKIAVDEALIRRGIPGRWPLYDNKDKKILSIVDIRGGFNDPVTLASKRYSRGPIVTGSLLWNGELWQSSWSLLMHNEGTQWQNRHWSLVGEDYKLLIDKAIDQAGDALGLVFAIHGSTSKQQWVTIHLNVQAINSIKKYSHIERYLAALNAVESAKPLRIDGHSVVFEVTLRSSENDFLNLIKNDAQLRQIEPQEIAVQLVPEDKTSLDSQNPVAAHNTNKQSDQPKPIAVHHYQLAH